jgi:hypothetical protein
MELRLMGVSIKYQVLVHSPLKRTILASLSRIDFVGGVLVPHWEYNLCSNAILENFWRHFIVFHRMFYVIIVVILIGLIGLY